ncbi:MAG TPA: right-handed parallel beta-helix repeat-containing protein [Acidimicrobiia bacterium]|jgi:predicted outer membrane repeat protein|nr:right-handed parallel beta-helix repeat-containing protein [Acidimicrobiia bacterium]HWW43870.1 right-handed parallel beta-helix repeat-containing protein [Acidimicrobiia bacterium]
MRLGRRLLSVCWVAAVFGAPVVMLAVTAAPAGAATTTITVDNAGDVAAGNAGHCPPVPAGTCTLRDAVAAGDVADGAGNSVVIDIPAALGPFVLTHGQLTPGQTMPWTMQGTGGVATIDQTTATNAVINVSTAAQFTLQNLTITGGHTTTSSGGGVIDFTTGPLTVQNSTVTGNTATGDGGGVAADAMTIVNSTITGNTGLFGGGLSGGPMTVVNSTVTGNTATAAGGGISVGGPNLLTLVYATIDANTAPAGANFEGGSIEPLVSFASVISRPQGAGTNCGGTLFPTTSHGFNDEDDAAASCGFRTAAGDLAPGTAPNLGALAPNGGPTMTQLPGAGSPLIDAVHAGACQTDGATGITADQRGLPRPDTLSPGCDTGAVEVQPPPSSPPGVITAAFTG